MITKDFKETLSLLQQQVELLSTMNKDFLGLSWTAQLEREGDFNNDLFELDKVLREAAMKLDNAQGILFKNRKI